MVSLVFKIVFKYVFLIDNKDPDYSTDSSLVPTFNKTPISTGPGKPVLSEITVIPLLNLVLFHSLLPTVTVLPS